MKRTPARHSHEAGSVFFLILIGIALFAALSYAMMKGSSTATSNLTADQARLAATEMIAFANTMQKSVQKLRLAGCAPEQFNFYNTVWKLNNGTLTFPSSHNPNRATDGSCDIFAINAGAVSPVIFPSNYFDTLGQTVGATSTPPGTSTAISVVVPATGTSAPDLVGVTPWISHQVCMKINEILGIKNNTNTGPLNTSSGAWGISPFDGNYQNNSFGPSDSQIRTGQSMFCTYYGSSPTITNRFFYTLVAR